MKADINNKYAEDIDKQINENKRSMKCLCF